MVIGNCFNQFIPRRDAISLRLVISKGSLICIPLCSSSAHIFSRNLI